MIVRVFRGLSGMIEAMMTPRLMATAGVLTNANARMASISVIPSATWRGLDIIYMG